jgi:hypothetical protein
MLIARKDAKEKWRMAVRRIAGRHGLAAECLEAYDSRTLSDDDAKAAWEALYEWDCLELVEGVCRR